MSKGRGLSLFALFLLIALGGWFLLGGGGVLPDADRPAWAGSEEGRGEARPPVPPRGIAQKGEEDGAEGKKVSAGEKGLRRALPGVRPTGETGPVLAGRVLGPGGGGLPGARVRVDQAPPGFLPLFLSFGGKPLAQGRTGPDGRWRIPLESGRWDSRAGLLVTAAAKGYVPGRVRVTLKKEKGLQEVPDLVLELGTQVWGRVTDEDGRPVKGASLSALGPGSFRAAPVKTDEMGRFSFPGFPPGKVKLLVDAQGYALAFREVEVVPSLYPLEVDFLLTRGLSVAGRVLDGAGKPVKGARVQLERFQEGGSVSMTWISQEESAETDEAGRFRIGGLEKEASFRLRVEAEGFLGKRVDRVKPGDQGVLVILGKGCSVRGRVVDFQGRPLASFWVKGARIPFDGGRKVAGGREKPGFFRLEGLRPGVWIFAAGTKGGLLSEPVVRKLRQGEGVDLGVLRVSRPAELVVRVLDGKGRPLEGVRVRADKEAGASDGRKGFLPLLRKAGVKEEWLRSAGGMLPLFFSTDSTRTGKTGADGLCRLQGLSQGEWSVTASLKGYTRGSGGPVSLVPGGEERLELRLTRGGTLLIKVRERDGSPRKGASLQVTRKGTAREGGKVSFQLVTDASGLAREEHLLPGTYEVRLGGGLPVDFGMGGPVMMGMTVPGRKKKDPLWVVQVREGETAALEILSPPRWRIEGVVAGRGGPVEGARVRISLPGASLPFGRTVRTKIDGSYSLEGIDPGKYRLSWGRAGCAVESSEEIILGPEGGVFRKDLSIPSGAVAGRVLDEGGRPLPGLRVRLGRGGMFRSVRMMVSIAGSGRRMAPLIPSPGVPEVRTGLDGRFLLEEVPPGTWDLAVEDPSTGKVLVKKKVKVEKDERADTGDLVARKDRRK